MQRHNKRFLFNSEDVIVWTLEIVKVLGFGIEDN
jgi:hypothetical protein